MSLLRHIIKSVPLYGGGRKDDPGRKPFLLEKLAVAVKEELEKQQGC